MVSNGLTRHSSQRAPVLRVRVLFRNPGQNAADVQSGSVRAAAVLGAAAGKLCSYARIRAYSNNYSTISDKQAPTYLEVRSARFVKERRTPTEQVCACRGLRLSIWPLDTVFLWCPNMRRRVWPSPHKRQPNCQMCPKARLGGRPRRAGWPTAIAVGK